MLPSHKRLSRKEFELFSLPPAGKTVFNRLGTIKYKKSNSNKVSIVISSKQEKRAVYRNKLRRRLYSLFRNAITGRSSENNYIFYSSKQATALGFVEIKTLFHELFEKTTK